MAKAEPIELIYSLVGYPQETEWLEFKRDNSDPVQIGKDISALANAAAWLERDVAYKVWGIDDESHALMGTTFDPYQAKGQGSQNLLIWLKQKLTPNANYEFSTIHHQDRRYVVLTIRAANMQPVCFQGQAYMREGSSTTELRQGSEKEVELWRRLQRANYELRNADGDLSLQGVEERLNLQVFFDLLHLQTPESKDALVKPLAGQNIIRAQDNGLYSITNLGALLLARDLESFAGLGKRAMRVLRFSGKSNIEIIEDITFNEGYATSLSQAEDYLARATPARESSDGMFRRISFAYPRRAIRELLANMAIHQDLSVANQGPLVCLYSNRIVFSNPGESLIQVDRILNDPPKTRNMHLVNLLRQMDICEEGGTGWDIAVSACESAFIPAPRITSDAESGTKVVLFSDLSYSRMSKAERLDALYWHACLKYAESEALSNQSLRERFGLDDSPNSSLAMSRLIREGCKEGLIKVQDDSVGSKARRYIPAWS